MQGNEKFGEGRKWFEVDGKEWKERRAKRKEEGRLKFESNFRVYLHFFQNSLSADYGTFICDNCNRKFYHSPSDVYYGAKKEYSSCCGHCVNRKMALNRQEEVYN